MKQKILFFHGFFASGAYITAQTIVKCFEGKALVLTPDLPLHPQEALSFIQQLCEQEKPDVLVSNSYGAFLAQIIAAKNNIPALLGNPHFEMTVFLSERIGHHEYKAPRADGNQHFVINQALIDEFADVQSHQWDYCQPVNRDRIWGIFGEKDRMVNYEPLFLKYYNHVFHFPGAHTPTADEVCKYYVPLIQELLQISHTSTNEATDENNISH